MYGQSGILIKANKDVGMFEEESIPKIKCRSVVVSLASGVVCVAEAPVKCESRRGDEKKFPVTIAYVIQSRKLAVEG